MSRASVVVVLRRSAIVAVLLAIATGLGNVDAPTPERRPLLDVVVAVDTTTSMAAQDHDAGSRLAAARDDLVALTQALPAARYTLVSFGSEAEVELRSGTDPVVVEEEVRALEVEAPTDGQGSRVDRGLPLLEDLVAPEALEESAGLVGGADLRRVLVFISDGENTAEGEQASFEPLSDDLDAALVLGFGTAQGGRMPADAGQRRQDENAGWVLDRETGAPALSRLDEDNLRDIAEESGGSYVHRTGADGMVTVAAELEEAAYAGLEEVDAERQVTWLWATLLLVLLLLELRVAWREISEGMSEVRS
ncbi:hypothetical protein NOK12_12230 [Nocardioides sp. OK12]|uniref:VWA domain-containing protein n=1 Tax=Nocardioides sp. OK12 TaxID=2758661 RepID=UPI0021C2FCF2|nr:VWA domain-containing protein [Nocardioides sp. OK12]GHJ58705.1 hypothetical protein NOK12_12230 [Nocardioides sp. OK12]